MENLSARRRRGFPSIFVAALGAGLALCAALSAPTEVAAQQSGGSKLAKDLFGAKSVPSAQRPRAIGGYAQGCLAGGETLAADGPGWQAMRLSRNRRHGHPELIALIERLAAYSQDLGWPGLLIGDLAQPRGGPMLSGHASHQIGLDGDIWLRPAPKKPLTRSEREKISAINYVAKDKRSVTKGFSDAHYALIRRAAEDDAVARIFINAALKKELCRRAEKKGDKTGWLRKVRPWWGHNYHFHVRLRCPNASRECKDQKPPPPGSGCDQLGWWLSDDVLFPKPKKTDKPKKKKKRKRDWMTLAHLPSSCAGVLKARDARP